MATAISTYRNIQDRVLEQISKSDAVTRNRVKNSINLGYHDFVLREIWPFREKTGTLSTVAATQEYDLVTNFSDLDENSIIAVTIQGGEGVKLVYWPYSQLRADLPDLDQGQAGIPQRYYIKAGQMGFWPVPADAYTIAVDYYITPTELDADSDEPIIPVGYREALMHYALSQEHDFNTDPDLAQKAMNRYEQIVNLARQNLLAQPIDTGNFRILGPADFRNHTEI